MALELDSETGVRVDLSTRYCEIFSDGSLLEKFEIEIEHRSGM